MTIKCGVDSAYTHGDYSLETHQPFPTTGVLAQNVNRRLSDLRSQLGSEDTAVYCYVIGTIKNRGGQFYQIGSGPNFQGGLITLCTCKHFMRAFMGYKEWPGKWVAGFCGIAAANGQNALVYLMQVGNAFKSHYDLWQFLPITTREAKAASRSHFGDVFEPGGPVVDCFDHRNYEPPVENHGHHADNAWHKDINYCHRHRASLLVGDPVYSFLWDRPTIIYKDGRIHRGQKKITLTRLFDKLEVLVQ